MMVCKSIFRQKAQHRVTIQELGTTTDAYGGQSDDWTTMANGVVWAMIEPTTGREVFAQGVDQSRLTHKITIRYKSALKSTAVAGKLRISYDGRFFPLKYIKNVDDSMKYEGKTYQILYCEENYPSAS